MVSSHQNLQIENFRRPGPGCQDFLEASSAHHGFEGYEMKLCIMAV